MKPLLLLFALLTPFADEPKAEKSDHDQIQGTWQHVSRRFKGENLKVGADEGVIFTRTLMRYQPEGPEGTDRYKLDSTSSPKRITTWQMLEEDGADGESLHCIYKLEGDTLTICFNVFTDQPRDFTAEKEDRNTIDVYRRVKTKATVPPR